MKHNKWSEEEIDFLKSNYKKYSNKELAKMLNRTPSSIHMKLGRLSLIRDDKYNYNVSFFKDIDTEEKAYWLGFIYADGYVQDTEDGAECGIELQVGDKKHLKKFNKSINGNVDVQVKEKYDNRYDKVYTHCAIRLYKREFVKHLMEHGVIPNKTFKIEFPELEDKLIIPFIRGFFDGDGCLMLNKNRRCHSFDFACVVLDFLNKIRNILYNYGINSYIFQEANGVYRLKIGGMKNAFLFGKLIYEDATIYLDRKYNKYNYITKKYDIINRIQNSRQ